MNFSQKVLSLNHLELNDLRKDFWQGWVGIVIIEVIGINFSFLFSGGFSKTSTNFVAFYIIYHLINNWRDLQNGTKILITGIVSNKFVKVRQAHGSSTLTSLYERTNHYIKVSGNQY